MKPAWSGPPLMPRKVSPSRREVAGHHRPRLARAGLGVAGHVADLGVREDPGVELGRLLQLVVEPEAGADGRVRGESHVRTDRATYADSSRHARSLDSKRGLLLGVRARVRPRRRLHAAGGDRRPGGQRARRAGAGEGVPRRRRGGRGLPGAVPDRLRHRRPAPAGHPARGRARARSTRSSSAAPTCCRSSSSALPLVHGTRVLNCAVVIHQGRILGVSAKSYLPTYREFYERRHFAPGDDRRGATIEVVRGRGAVRPRPDLRRLRPSRPQAARRDLRGHVGAGAAERGGVPGRRDRAGQPVRQPDHRRPRRGPPAAGPQRERALQRGVRLRRRRAGRVDDRPELGRPDDGLRVRRAAGRGAAVPRGAGLHDRRHRPRPAAPGPAAAGHPRRQPAYPRRAGRGVPDHRVRARRAHRRRRAAAQGGPVPVRPGRPGAARARLLRGLQHPGLRARAAAHRHRRSRRRSSASAAASTRRTR